jgi:hypothetical protein
LAIPPDTKAGRMTGEPTITCPNCKAEVKLTESLAAPLIETTRRQYEQRLAQQTGEMAKRESALRAREESLAKEKEAVDAAVAEKLKSERGKIAAEESRRVRAALADDLEQRAKEIADLRDVLKTRDEKLAEAQKAQAEVMRKGRELDDARRELDLTVEKKVQSLLAATREQAKREAEDALSLKVLEKEQTIAAMQKQIEELKHRAEQGSQQLQGEVLETYLESLLAARFPHDRIEPVPKGEHGGDVLQRVVTPAGAACGTILWECKRAKHWSDLWLAKLREDQRTAKAEIAVVASSVLPKGVETFDQVDGVWVVHPRAVVPVAMSLRQMLMEVNCARQASEGQQTKMALTYQYLTGPKFRLRMQAIVEAFTTMSDDLLREKKAALKQWAKRETQINRAVEAAAGMYGELQGIAGQSLKEIEGLEVRLLESAVDAA